MKNAFLKFLIVISLVVSGGLVQAQDFQGGVTLGGVFSQVDGDSYAGYHKPGAVFGGFVNRKMSRYWDMQLEIVFKQKGAHKIPDHEKGDYTEYKIELNYIELPLLAKLHQGKFTFEGGVSFGNLISSNEWDQTGPLPENITLPFENYEIALLLGINYHFSRNFWINTRLSYSLNRVRYQYGDDVKNYNPHVDIRKTGQYNNSVSISIFYSIDRLF